MDQKVTEGTKKQRHVLRHEVLTARDKLSPLEISEKSGAVAARVVTLPEIIKARTILTYMHFRSEVETTRMIQMLLTAGKKVSIPCTKVDTSELIAVHITDPTQQVVPGYCGIPEPLPELVAAAACAPEQVDIVMVPGSVFDKDGGRLGYGGGYYDRFLAIKSPTAVRVGIAFEMQVVDEVPVEPHDQRMDYVVTEKRVYECRRNGNA